MATLRASRNKFFAKHRMPADRSFWLFYLELTGQLADVPTEDVELMRTWKPVRSNCFELTATMEDLIDVMPQEWRALASNLFVGRVLDGEVNASAFTHRQAGIVEINVQYTHILHAYVTSYDHHFHAIRTLLRDTDLKSPEINSIIDDLNEQGLVKPWSALEESKIGWADLTAIFGVDEYLREPVADGRASVTETSVAAAESWIISHELAHHILGHTVTRPNTRNARQVVYDVWENADLLDETVGISQSQLQELQADTLAFLLVADAVEDAPTFSRLYKAMYGAAFALISLAHVTDSWVNLDNGSTHPDFYARIRMLSGLVEWFSQGRPKGPAGDHPLGMWGQISSFCAVATHVWLSRAYPDDFKPLGILQVADYLIDYGADVEKKIPSLPSE